MAKKKWDTPHKIAFAADVTAGIALLIIGICGTHFGFLSIQLQSGLTGAGAAYMLGILSLSILFIKNRTAPDSFLIKTKQNTAISTKALSHKGYS